jgi:hypothetical protein
MKILLQLIGFILILYSIGIFSTQCYLLLNEGTWLSLPATYMVATKECALEYQLQLKTKDLNLDEYLKQQNELFDKISPHLLVYNGDQDNWFSHPTSMLGLHKIVLWVLNLLSIPVIIYFIGLIFLQVSKSISAELVLSEQANKTPRKLLHVFILISIGLILLGIIYPFILIFIYGTQ